jgi:uncharacterized protein YegP (UPF0339 family)
MKIVCYKGKGRQPWRWRLVASNGKVVADSAEGYAKRGNLKRAVRRLANFITFAVQPEVVWR